VKKSPSPRAPRASTAGWTHRTIHYVVSSHWDREWYQTFQGFRQRLVRLLDRCIADLDQGALGGPFTTDGQAIILDDYLEVRPERAAQVRELVRTGRFKVGPWFVLPDEWLVSGESIIRNLELGRATARRYGAEPSNAGFVCDLFGHVGQLPQIFAGFGIDSALLWRGLEPRPATHFWWEAPDGTRILGYRFPRTAYCDYAWDVRRCHQPPQAFDATRAARDLDVNLAREVQRTPEGPILLFDGGDHLEYDIDFYRALFARQTGPDFPFTVRHSTLDEYIAEVRAQAGKITDRVVGELRETGARPCVEDQQWLIPGVLSSRVWIKQANARCQALLCHWAEPFGAATHAFCGLEYPAGFLAIAWRWLLANHPHDSICGCSIDAVHEDMKYRFAQCEQIAENLAREQLLSLAVAVAAPLGDKELRVLVANPLPRPHTGIVELTLHIPADWGCFNEFFGFEPKPAFRIYDQDGREVPYQRLTQAMNRTQTRLLPRNFPQVYKTHDVTVALALEVPALGYTTLSVREGEKAPKDEIIGAATLPTRHPGHSGLATSECTMENELIGVTIEANGTLTLRDKRNGAVYDRLLTFEDVADIGDGWYHGPAVNDQAIYSTLGRAEVALVANGPLLARFRIRTTLTVPAEFRFDRMTRSEACTDLVIDSTVTLRRGSDRLEFRTQVYNPVRDHRLRVLFPSGAQAATYLADSAFDVVERPIALPADNHTRRELAVETGPQQTWTAVADGRRGLAIIATGLLESAVRDLPDRPIALTLFRATRRTVFTDGEPQGQLPGELAFAYWIAPVVGAPDRVRLCNDGILLGAGLRDCQVTSADRHALFVPVTATLPASASYLTVAGEVVVTSVRERDGILEVRLFNPGSQAATANFDFAGRPAGTAAPTRVAAVNFEGVTTGQPTAVRAGRHRTTLRPKQILTLRFT
jgi:hypothetical protein